MREAYKDLPNDDCGLLGDVRGFLEDETWPDLVDRIRIGMEMQITVQKDKGERFDKEFRNDEGEIVTFEAFKNGVDEFWPIRIPRDANENPKFNYFRSMPWYPAVYAKEIGGTGWDWWNKKSRWVGFDFDSMVGHKIGLSAEELEEIRERVKSVPWVELRRSTGGKGWHVYVFLKGEATQNRAEHMAVAKAVLEKLSGICGFDFAQKVDGQGGNMWFWRKDMPENGLELIKEATELCEVPDDWKKHVKKQSKPAANVKKADVADDQCKPAAGAKKLDLTPDQQKLLNWLKENHPNCHVWKEDMRMLRTHTVVLKLAHMALGLPGTFETISPGTELHDPNCWAKPLLCCGWNVGRFGAGPAEHPSWSKDEKGQTVTTFACSPPPLRLPDWMKKEEKKEDWPVLHPDAMFGLTGKIVKTIEPHSEADPIGILVQHLVVFGNRVGRGAYFQVEATRHHTNLFSILAGDTSRGRKGTSEGQVRGLYNKVEEKGISPVSGLVSGQGLIWLIRDDIVKKYADKKTGEIKEKVVEFGVDDKRLLIVESEFANTLKVMGWKDCTLSAQLRQAWDGDTMKTAAKNAPATASNPHVSMIGHITVEELRACMCAVDAKNGNFNRCLWLSVRRSKKLPDGGGRPDLSEIVPQLQGALEFAKTAGEMKRDVDAGRLWNEFYTSIPDCRPGLFGAVTDRGEAQVLRLSMTYALLDKSNVIRAEHLRAAIAVWKYCEESARKIFGDSTGDPLADKILNITREREGVTRSELFDATGKNYSKKEIEYAVNLLLRMNLIKEEDYKTGGRTGKKYLAA
jgi:hypothetical protein